MPTDPAEPTETQEPVVDTPAPEPAVADTTVADTAPTAAEPPARPRRPKTKLDEPTGAVNGLMPKFQGKRGPGSDWVHSQAALGRRLKPPRERAFLSRLTKRIGCPGARPNGDYHVPSWQTWLDSLDLRTVDKGIEGEEIDSPVVAARRESLELNNEMRRIELEVLRGQAIHLDDAEAVITAAVASLSQRLFALPAAVSHKLAGHPVGTIQKRLQEELRDALAPFASLDWAPKKKAFWQALSARLSESRQRSLPGLGASVT